MKLRTRADSLPAPDRGFSLIELLVVVALIAVMAAVGLPNLVGYLRQAKVRGAMQQVAGEMQAARNKAIVKNTNAGVACAIIDADTYRFFVADTPTTLGPIRQLPQGVTFVAGTLPGFAFTRLGSTCEYGTQACPYKTVTGPTLAELCPTPHDDALCQDHVKDNYVTESSGTFFVEMIENTTGTKRRVEVGPGGRVVTQ